MKIILVEFPWQAKKISENKRFQNFVIVSTDPEASYILKKNNYRYFETHEFCDHETLLKKYKHITENSLKIVKILDNYLWKFDKRFKDLKWNFFDDFHFIFKISYEQVYYYIELISQLVEKFNPSQFTIADTENIKFDKNLLIDNNISLFKFLFNNLKITEKKIEIKYMSPDPKNINSKLKSNFNKKFLNKKLIKEKMKNFYYKLDFYFNYFLTKPQYFSIGGYEINMFKKLYPNESKQYICYKHENISHTNPKSKWKYFDNFCMALNNDSEFKLLTNYQKKNFDNLFFEIISQLSKSFANFIKEYTKAKKIIDKIKPKCLIFESMTPFYTPNVIFRKICKDLKLPYVTWVHGGQSNYSLHGFDVSDYRLCHNHISYGIHLKEILKNEKSILNQLNLQKNLKIYPIGSARFDYYIKKRKSKKILRKNNKFNIVYVVGLIEGRNQFYFGYNRKNFVSMEWEFQYQVIKLLQKYQYKYNIIVKDFPTGYPVGRSLWKNVLCDLDANNISYISGQFAFTDLLKISDLNLFPCRSTPLFESLYFDADIFFMEDEDEIDLNIYKNKLKNELFYFSNMTEYIKELEKYLDQGIFYKRKKENSRDYFINYKHFAKRDKLLSQALSQIVQEKKELNLIQ